MEALEAKLKAEHPSWLAFCHNDLQCGNVMLDASSLARISSGPSSAADAPPPTYTVVWP